MHFLNFFNHLAIKNPMRFKLLLVFFMICHTCFAQQKTVPVIFDSDMGPDYDDVGAITLLHAFADSGKAKILATIASTKFEGVAGVFSVLNTYFNRPDVPIGVPRGKAVTQRDWQHWTDTLLANYPHQVMRNEDVPDATELYRKILAAQPDKSVTIITVGFFTNLASLLQSRPDKYSKLNGRQLVQKKVKRVVSMAGKFPSGKEFNIEKDAAAAQLVFKTWPTPIICSGFEIGEKIKTGLPLIHNAAIQNSPVKDVFRISIPMDKQDSAGRMSWDETAVLVGIAGYGPYYTLKPGKVVVADDGSNTWVSGKGNHAYIVPRMEIQKVQELLNDLMMHQPSRKE
ncbi:MAG TPA: nucleoside hydrolase [Niastella sp.]|nr:nucleoside hydrolase [Niastella sp.]